MYRTANFTAIASSLAAKSVLSLALTKACKIAVSLNPAWAQIPLSDYKINVLN